MIIREEIVGYLLIALLYRRVDVARQPGRYLLVGVQNRKRPAVAVNRSKSRGL